MPQKMPPTVRSIDPKKKNDLTLYLDCEMDPGSRTICGVETRAAEMVKFKPHIRFKVLLGF